ncbi:RNA-binding S4 domain-containing protein [Robbsia sp. Bb-Pol-6]|uniref:RNA-binding S4 domain-containing protein n=1 Tax=Robbsia betulipollinis TaxID=2981849 RepID=A0ABT3ZRD1_9BURK|nr:RNA-binding S4 domain-containing protein [Robbsia betulipollinis]MCY0388832.1 RNA-binding S4 domain-containing protein [Robbsia betulipollinis]
MSKTAPAVGGKPLALTRVRIDKWVWAARFFKTRSLAAQAVEKGRVRIGPDGGETVKAARDVRVGDTVTVEIEQTVWEVAVVGISDVRGPAPVARLLYEETESGRARREAEGARRRLYREPGAERDGRPTKRERRTIDRFGTPDGD